MSSSTFDFNTIEHFILSPGDIYWIKKSGEEVLVTKKGEIPNIILCKKLIKHEHVLEMRNEVSVEAINALEEYFYNSKIELMISKKNIYRKKILEILHTEYTLKPRIQFEFDIMVWKIFSKFSLEEQSNLANIDMDLFKRSLRVCSSLVMGAFLIGYYDEKFLEVLFNKSMKLLMSTVTIDSFADDKAKLEKMRQGTTSFDIADEEVRFLFDPNVFRSEVSSWEKLLVSFNRHFPFDSETDVANVLHELSNNKFELNCDEIRTMQKVLKKASTTNEFMELT